MELNELLQKAAERIKTLKDKLAEYEAEDGTIAIISTACRFPGGSNTPEKFWQTLMEGHHPIQLVSPERWPEEAISTEIRQKYPGTQWAGLMSDIDKFDADFFGIGAVEAESMDPQQRLLLEVSWEAFERAGLSAKKLSGSSTGVFIGMVGLDYKDRVEDERNRKLDLYAATGNALCTTSGRLSYVFGLEGPSLSVETACSSSLVALHQACHSLRAKDCNLALVGASNIIISPKAMSLIGVTGALAPEGKCRTFDSLASGFVRSEGCGVILLKRLSDAERDKDRILAIIRGSSINQDGRSIGFTAPNVLSQQRLLRDALDKANLTSSHISYIEAHGTGTSLGDPIETEAIKAVFGDREKDKPCILGSVKSNIGHLEAAAGIAGLIKLTLMFEHEKIPAQLHFNKLNPYISLDSKKFLIPTHELPWKRGEPVRYAGISSFGFSGTNVHVILEEGLSPQLETENPQNPQEELLVLSARTPKAVLDLANRYMKALQNPNELQKLQLSDISYSAAVKRTHYEYRIGVTGKTHAELVQKFSSLKLADVAKTKMTNTNLVFLFQGKQAAWIDMAEMLFYSERRFQEKLKECDAYFMDVTGFSLLEKFKQQSLELKETDAALSEILANFIKLSYADLLTFWGVVPKAVVGDGNGVFIAGYICQALDFQQTVKALIRTSRCYAEMRLESSIDLNLILDALKLSDNSIQLVCPQNKHVTAQNGWKLEEYETSELIDVLTDLNETESEGCVLMDFSFGSEAVSMNTLGGKLLKVFQSHKDPREATLHLLGKLYCHSSSINFENIMTHGQGWDLLPTYPWQHESYWIPAFYEKRVSDSPSVSEKNIENANKEIPVGPVNLKEVIISTIASILGIPVERVRTEQHLFEIGIDSISAMRFINQMQKEHSVVVSLPDLLREGSIDKLVAWLEMNPEAENTNPRESENNVSNSDFSFVDEMSESDAQALEELLRMEAI
ncbi:MAG: acyltransferase domain-containing protein [Alphaproteobacteria bacterium]|nr:acyltransferase domain-containing protein [Alphaproteobacteria bacterium]